MDLAGLMDHARMEKDPLGESGLASVDVRRDADVAQARNRKSIRICVQVHNGLVVSVVHGFV